MRRHLGTVRLHARRRAVGIGEWRRIMSVNSVIVRMYRKLLGDCFLIIVEDDGKYSKTLVDCGILQGTPGGDDWMRKVVDNVYRSFGPKLDLVVVTHEHWDHISGFL